jgi:RimJ/RimL family protein N-acetyltransferase
MNTPGMFPTKPTLQGTRALLRPFAPADIEAMGAILAEAEVLRLTGSVHSSAEAVGLAPHLDAATRQWYETRVEQTDRLDLAIVDASTGRCVGEAVLNEVSMEDDSCNFRILIGEGGRNRGIGKDATRLLLDHAFTATRLNRVELEVYDFNPRAQHVYELCGFVHEGRRRSAFKFDGSYVDALVMAALRSDWVAATPKP